jgi:hypothetical protein
MEKVFSVFVHIKRPLISSGFVESSDGTSHRATTVESRHITLRVPSYAPDVDDTDKSTWTTRTRFLNLEQALDHTAQRQFDGAKEAASRIADTYTRSPIAAQKQQTMHVDDYYRKKLGEMKDHAADGKKGFGLSAAHKEAIVIRDLGRDAIDDADMETSQILLGMLDITDEDLQLAAGLSPSELTAL